MVFGWYKLMTFLTMVIAMIMVGLMPMKVAMVVITYGNDNCQCEICNGGYCSDNCLYRLELV